MGKKDGFRVFLIGDNYSGTGPAIVTDSYLKNLPADTLHLTHKSKILRAFEIFFKMPKADAVLFSGYSRQNLFGMRIASFFGKKCAYLMHGCVEYENRINRVNRPAEARDERKMLKRADLILAVSRQFEEWLKENYPEFRRKISHLTNGVDWSLVTEQPGDGERNPFGVISVGGGMPRKRIAVLCKALQKLIDEGNQDITLTVAGDTGADSDLINSYPFVRNVGLVSHEKLMELYRSNKLFVQNSCFETFGLAPIEALLSETEVLISVHCGALSVIKNTEPSDVIYDTENPEEIAGKVRALLAGDNHTRLICELDKESTSWKKRSGELLQKMREIIG